MMQDSNFYDDARWLWNHYHIESDESLLECMERTIDGWKQRALKAERGRDALYAIANRECANEEECAALAEAVLKGKI